MAKSLKEKKEQLKENFEKCFEVKLEDVFTEVGIKKYWDENTSVEKAVNMLDKAALNLAIDAMKGDVVGAIIMMCEAMMMLRKRWKRQGKMKSLTSSRCSTQRVATSMMMFSLQLMMQKLSLMKRHSALSSKLLISRL